MNLVALPQDKQQLPGLLVGGTCPGVGNLPLLCNGNTHANSLIGSPLRTCELSFV